MPRYEVSAPPDVLILQSDDLNACGNCAAFNAKLSGEIILIVDLKSDKVVGVGVPPNVKVFVE